MQYSDVVRYDLMDPLKRAAQAAARETAHHLDRFRFRELEWTRGESVYVVETPWCYVGFVVEGLGTKNLAADRLRDQVEVLKASSAMGAAKFAKIDLHKLTVNTAICNVAMSLNDMATLGIRPVVFGMHLSTGSPRWFEDEERWQAYIRGTVDACHMAHCSYGCGETPTLAGIVEPNASELSGAAWGICSSEQLIKGDILVGDRIIIIGSSGIHANGLTLARKVADTLPQGYLTPMGDGKTYGEGLLAATLIYNDLVERCQELGAKISYAVNVTGHGWRKFMRATEPFIYVFDGIPKPQPVFEIIQEYGGVTTRNMYKDFNMGAGFALYVRERSVPVVERACRDLGYDCLDAGFIKKSGDEKRVEIRPLGITFEAEELAVR